MSTVDRPGPQDPKGEHSVVLEELRATVDSEPFQRFLSALREMSESERDTVLDVVLTGPVPDRLDLELPLGVQLSRGFVEGPAADFALSKRAHRTGALVTVFITLFPSADGQQAFQRVLPCDPSTN